MNDGITYALFGILAVTIGGILWFGKYFARYLVKALIAHTKASDRQVQSNTKLTQAVVKNTESNQEVLTFMKNLNGKLAKATIQTVQEQTVQHQTVEHTDVTGKK